MRNLAILLAVLAVALGPSAAFAKNDKTPPGQVENSDQPDKPDPPGKPDSPGQPDPPGQDKQGDKPEPPGQTKNGDTIPAAPSTADEVTAAQRAVEAREALPLARIITIAEAGTTGHVINARLTRVDKVLLYQLTFLDDAGRSWREYYYARTGNPVVIR